MRNCAYMRSKLIISKNWQLRSYQHETFCFSKSIAFKTIVVLHSPHYLVVDPHPSTTLMSRNHPGLGTRLPSAPTQNFLLILCLATAGQVVFCLLAQRNGQQEYGRYVCKERHAVPRLANGVSVFLGFF